MNQSTSQVRVKDQWARLYIDNSEESHKAVELLRTRGYAVITFPVEGILGPELRLGRIAYKGLEQINKVTEGE